MRNGIERLGPGDYPFPSSLLRELLTPALVIFADTARANALRIIELCGGDPGRWRPHLKTTKSPVVWGWLLDLGVRHFKCATLKEARLLLELVAERGVTNADLLFAQPLIGPPLTALGTLAERFSDTRTSVLCEDADAVQQLPSQLGVFVDINNGMDRTGVPLEDFARVRAIARASGDRFRGLHAYEGLVAGGFATRAARCRGLYIELEDQLGKLRADGLRVEELVTSGTPAFLMALAHPGFRSRSDTLQDTVHRVSPGTVVFHDTRSASDVPALDLRPAALVVSRVLSHPRPGRVTCDAGSKALAAEVGDPCAVALGHPELVARTPSEEHLPFDTTADTNEIPLPARGDLLTLVPAHVCPTVNLAQYAWLVESDGSFRVLPIAARGHELGC